MSIKKRGRQILFIFIGLVVIACGVLAWNVFAPQESQQRSQPLTGNTTGKPVINVVAAENFYGDIASQLGGTHVAVKSMLANPNVDPHEFESSISDAIAVANADVVIENGLGYDTWMDKLIAASPREGRAVLVAGTIAPDVLPDNPHVWYGIDNIPAIARAIVDAYQKIDPADSADFEANLTVFDHSLEALNAKIEEIKRQDAGMPIALTETIYLYQSQPMGLRVLTPFNFEKAIAEGNDPSAQDVAATNAQITSGQVKILVYNNQTVTPITTNLQTMALQHAIPIVPVTETMPAGLDYETWMMQEMNALETALAKS